MSTSGSDIGRAADKDDAAGKEATEALVRSGLSTVSTETWRALLVAIVAIAAVTVLVLQIPRALPDESDGRLTELVELSTRVGS